MKNTNVIPIQKIPSILENDYQFIDLRDPYEYKKVHLTKFTNIPYEKFDHNQYYFSKKEPLTSVRNKFLEEITCTSKKLADDLCQQGYDAYSIEGGFYSILHQKT